MFQIERMRKLQDALVTIGAGAMYVRHTTNIAWLCGFSGVFDEEQAHAMLVPATGDVAWLHTDSRYSTALEREANGTPIQVDAEDKRFAAWAHDQAEKQGLLGSAPLAIEDGITLAEYRTLQDAFGSAETLMETDGLIVGLRAVKSDHEVRLMEATQAVTDAAFQHIVGFMRPGMTEREVQLELDWFMLQHGADGLAFPTIVASGPNGASPHAVVSERRLQPSDSVVMDFGARWQGYCSDMTRTVFVGAPVGSMADAWAALRRANETVEAELKPGMTGKEAHELALSVLEEAGFGGLMGHGLGHGVGLDIHEEPTLSPRNDKPLVPGNVVTVEPGIYIPDAFGMRLEDFGVITEDGFRPFTQSTHEMVVI